MKRYSSWTALATVDESPIVLSSPSGHTVSAWCYCELNWSDSYYYDIRKNLFRYILSHFSDLLAFTFGSILILPNQMYHQFYA